MAKKGNVYGDRITTPIGRISYPHIFQKTQPYDSSKSPRYECDFLIPKSADMSAFNAALEAVAKEAFGARFKGLDKLKHPPFEDGDELDKPEYRGYWRLKTHSDRRISVVGPDRQPIDEDDDDGIYGGCWARLNITPGSYDVSGSWGVTLYLNGVQKVKDGERFGGSPPSVEEMFDEYSTDDGAVGSLSENL